MVTDQEIDKKVLNETADGLSGNTPIMFATIENKLPFMERMLALGCHINKKNKENYIALHFGNIFDDSPLYSILNCCSCYVLKRRHCTVAACKKIQPQQCWRSNDANCPASC